MALAPGPAEGLWKLDLFPDTARSETQSLPATEDGIFLTLSSIRPKTRHFDFSGGGSSPLGPSLEEAPPPIKPPSPAAINGSVSDEQNESMRLASWVGGGNCHWQR